MRLFPPFFAFCAIFRLSCRASSPLPRRRRERGIIFCQLASLWFTIIQFTLFAASSPPLPRLTHGTSRNGAKMRPLCVFLSPLILQGESTKTAYKRHFKPYLTICRIFSPPAGKLRCSPAVPYDANTAFFRFRRHDRPPRLPPRFQKDGKKRERLFTALPLMCQSLCICFLSLSVFDSLK